MKMPNDNLVTVTVRGSDGVIADGVIDVTTRKVKSLVADDEKLERGLIGMAVLSGCIEAILKEEFERRRAH